MEPLRRLQVKLVTTGIAGVLVGLMSAALGWILPSLLGGLVFLVCLAAIFVVGVVAWRSGNS